MNESLLIRNLRQLVNQADLRAAHLAAYGTDEQWEGAVNAYHILKAELDFHTGPFGR